LVRFGGLNTRIFKEVGEKFNITGFPWVSSFYQGAKTDDMAGLGGADSVINWANKKIADHSPSGIASAPAPAPDAGSAGAAPHSPICPPSAPLHPPRRGSGIESGDR
jgi:hypothetical protein